MLKLTKWKYKKLWDTKFNDPFLKKAVCKYPVAIGAYSTSCKNEISRISPV